MAELKITFPDNLVKRILDGMAGQNGYQNQIEDPPGTFTPNPETKVQFSKRMIKQYVKNNVIAWEATQAGETAREDAQTKAETEVTIT